jgi:CubicO group peptidase (beta-lactamase class C family)
VSGRTLTDVLEHHSFAHQVPGAGVGLVVDGEVYTAYSGLADRAAGTPVTPATRFGIGSLTKSMVASALAMLAADRRLAFDDPVAIHVPELRSCAWAQASSLRDLLANRSPIPLTSALEFGFEEHKDEDDQALTRLVSAVSAGVPSEGTLVVLEHGLVRARSGDRDGDRRCLGRGDASTAGTGGTL